MTYLRLIFKYLISLVYQPEQTWTYLQQEGLPEGRPDYVQANFYWPWLALSSALVFLFCGFNASLEEEAFIDAAMHGMVPYLTAYFVSPYVSQFVLRFPVVYRFIGIGPDADRQMVLIYYCTGLIMLCEVIGFAMPLIHFFDFLLLYVIFVIWCAGHSYLLVADSGRLKFSLFTMLVLWGSPWLVRQCLSLLSGTGPLLPSIF